MWSSSCVIKGWSCGLTEPCLDFIRLLTYTNSARLPAFMVLFNDYEAELRACVSGPDLIFWDGFCRFFESDTFDCAELLPWVLLPLGLGKLPLDRLPIDDIRLPPPLKSPSTRFWSLDMGPVRGPFDDLICRLAGIGPILLKLGASYSKLADKVVFES